MNRIWKDRRAFLAWNFAICCVLAIFFSSTTRAQSGDDFAFDANDSEYDPVKVAESTETNLTFVAKVPNGTLAKLDGVCDVIFLEGTPQEMGRAHGALAKDKILALRELIYAAGAAASSVKGVDFFEKTDEATKRSLPYVPKRFYDEIDAMCESAGISQLDGRRLNNFPELFHCSGITARGKATKGERVLHVRVLDYARGVGLQNYSQITIYRPKGYNAWLSVSFAGFVGTVTAMNEKGLTVGEMGGGGEGNWDGLPMTYLMRRIVEECSTVDEAIQLMKSVPLTCEYYYCLSDASGAMAAIAADVTAEQPVVVLRPGEAHERLPGALDDICYVSAGARAEALFARLKENYGKLDVATLMEIIKRPVSMDSNLHDAIFAPETLDVWRAEATASNPACDEPYLHINLTDALNFFDERR